jgi:hypothetical protein
MKSPKTHSIKLWKGGTTDSKMKSLTDPFDVIDALAGTLRGDYAKDLKRLESVGKTCSESLYNQAYQMDQQP